MKKSTMSVGLLTRTIPTGADVVDAVTTWRKPLGAVLVKFKNTGVYALVNRGVVESCDQREAKKYVQEMRISC